MVRTVVVGLVVAFVIFYAVSSPDSAANIVHATWHSAVGIAHGVGRFVDRLSS